jgi:hypothetical protein
MIDADTPEYVVHLFDKSLPIGSVLRAVNEDQVVVAWGWRDQRTCRESVEWRSELCAAS